jgi:peptidoglycan/LPS O-acetylase OafA/YrhL
MPKSVAGAVAASPGLSFGPTGAPTLPSGTAAEVAAIVRGKTQRLHTLDSIRGIAAAIVVIHHCFLTQPAFSDFFFSTWQTPANDTFQFLLFHTPLRLLWAGYEAVTLFYVLSGLVLALPWIERRPPSYRSYITKRIFRIYVPYMVAMVFAFALNIWLTARADVPGASHWVDGLTWTNPVTAFVVVDHILMLGHRVSVNGVIHSLVWEMRVSLIFPFLMLPIVWWRTKGAVLTALGLMVIIAGFQFGFATPNTPPLLLASSELHGAGKLAVELQWTAYYALFFVLGAVLTLHLAAIRGWLARMPWAGWACLGVGLLMFQAHWSQIHALQETGVALGSALIIMAGLAPGRIEAVLSLRFPQFLGRISYSLYLVHVPLLLTAVILTQGIVPMFVVLLCVPPASILLGWLFHETVAQPCVRWGQSIATRLDRPRRPAVMEATHG